MTAPPNTVVEVLKSATDYLAGKGIDQPRLAAELLASRLLNCKRLELYLRYDSVLTEKLLVAMRRGTKRVGDGEPVQYVIGQWDFMGRTFKTDKRALIPRPETELLVEKVLACNPIWDKGPENKTCLVEIGTGSGCIVISLALERPASSYLALDISDEALALAKENAATFNLADRIIFANADLADLIEPATVDAIIANLPYVTTFEYENLPGHIRGHEPRMALDGGPDGLSVIETVIEDAAIALRPGGYIFLEIGDAQGQKVSVMLTEAGFSGVAIHKDLNNRDRIAIGTLSGD